MYLNPNISKLNLSNKGLNRFPEELLRFKNLKKLNLSNNNIKQIPSEISKMKRLETLDLSNNQLTSIFSNICKLPNLKNLILNNNQIKTLPIQINHLKALKKLSVANNNLTNIPEVLSELAHLESLNISNNLLIHFPLSILRLKELRYLWINNNNFNDFPANQIILELSSLKAIYCYSVSKNKYDEISPIYRSLTEVKGNSIVELKKLNIRNSSRKQHTLSERGNQKTMEKNKIFISYAQKDNEWLEKVLDFIKTMTHEGINLDVWSDKKIKAGDKWQEEIEKALNESYIAILLVSTNFLASDFIRNNELPHILDNVSSKGTKILSLIISPCRFVNNKEISKFQAVNDPKNPLSKGSSYEQDVILLKLTNDIEDCIK